MFVSLSYLILLIVVASSTEKQIRLEDIERDNLLNERRAKPEVLKIEQPQHSRTPHSQSYEVGIIFLLDIVSQTGFLNFIIIYFQPFAENAGIKLIDYVVYAQSNTDISQKYSRLEPSSRTQYVTPQQYENGMKKMETRKKPTNK